MLQIIRHEPQKVDLYSPAGELIATLNNDIEVNHIQVQIAKENVSGYYLMWKDIKISINKQGELDKWPAGMYDHMLKLFAELWEIRKAKQTKS
jgi:predicted ATPase